MHQHTFTEHVGLRTSFGVLAWVPVSLVYFGVPSAVAHPHPTMLRCEADGEQGYVIPA